jgi:hypothetical protein
VKIALANGDTAEVPATWQPWPETPFVVAVKYEVRLERVVTIAGRRDSTIQLWVITNEPPGAAPDELRRQWRRFQFWCHGLTFDDSTYSPAGSEVPKILEAGWTQIECADPMQAGQIIVYYGADGSVEHSATANGDGTFRSKEGQGVQNNTQTRAGMDRIYPGTTTKCFRRRS